MIDLDMCVPPDERLSSKKLAEFISSSIEAFVYYVIQEEESLSSQEPNTFKSFDEVHYKYSGNRTQVQVEGWFNNKIKNILPATLFKEVANMRKKNPLKVPSPRIISGATSFA